MLTGRVGIDGADLGAVLGAAAVEAVLEARRLAIVRVISCDVAAVTTPVGLHGSGTVDDTRVARRPLLGTPVTMTTRVYKQYYNTFLFRLSSHIISTHLNLLDFACCDDRMLVFGCQDNKQQ